MQRHWIYLFLNKAHASVKLTFLSYYLHLFQHLHKNNYGAIISKILVSQHTYLTSTNISRLFFILMLQQSLDRYEIINVKLILFLWTFNLKSMVFSMVSIVCILSPNNTFCRMLTSFVVCLHLMWQWFCKKGVHLN